MKQLKALGISQAGLPFEFSVSVTLQSMGWALWQRQQKRVTWGVPRNETGPESGPC